MKILIGILFLFALFLFPFNSFGQNTIVFTEKSKTVDIGNSVYLLKDENSEFTIENIQKPEIDKLFFPSKSHDVNLGTNISTYWVKFTIENKTNEACLLEMGNVGLQNIDVFIPNLNGSYRFLKSGFRVPYKEREYQTNLYLNKIIEALQTKPQTIYIRIKSDIIYLPLKIGTKKAFLEKNHRIDIFYGIYYGFAFVIFSINFFVFLNTKEKSYLFYCIHVVSACIVNTSLGVGYGFELLWPDFSEMNFYLISVITFTNITMIVFSSSFLETRKNLPGMHKGLYVFATACVLLIGINLSGKFYFATNVMVQILNLFLVSYLLVMGFMCYKNGVRQARFYIVAWGIFLTSIFVYILFRNDVLGSNFFTQNCVLIGSSFETLLLTFAIVDKINILRYEKQAILDENTRIIHEQNKILEENVQKRTEEITAQNEELMQQQEEIASQRDILMEQNSRLLEAQTIIEEQNEEIKSHNEHLESEVIARTHDLQNTNHELIQYNHQLEQYAFVTAHNLRAPVARILGLTSILTITHESGENQFVIGKIVETSQELDGIIKDLNLILEIRKGSSKNLSEIDIEKKLAKIKKTLENQIKETKAEIIEDFSETQFVYSLRPYIESILYNLISNSLKYSDPSRSPVISIKTKLKDDLFYLTISDNGIGIDLNSYRDKMFGLYKRFHNHVEGKGLGLYLVKTQVNALEGDIEVESELGQGTTFHITLPIRKPV